MKNIARSIVKSIAKNKISNRQIEAIERYFEINNIKGSLTFNEKTNDWTFRPNGKVPFSCKVDMKVILPRYDKISYRRFDLIEAELKTLGVTFETIPTSLRLMLRYKTGRR